jgi:hypothetical protein
MFPWLQPAPAAVPHAHAGLQLLHDLQAVVSAGVRGVISIVGSNQESFLVERLGRGRQELYPVRLRMLADEGGMGPPELVPQPAWGRPGVFRLIAEIAFQIFQNIGVIADWRRRLNVDDRSEKAFLSVARFSM